MISSPKNNVHEQIMQSNQLLPSRSKSINFKLNTDKNKVIELPLLPFRKILTKIGGIPKEQYTPRAQQYTRFRYEKEKELRDKYYHRSLRKEIPFQFQLDEIVLDCFKKGDHGAESIWKRYKQNFDDLTYNTLRVTSNKRKL